jgi:hypothetical protein
VSDPARELLTFLRAAGFTVRADGERLFVLPRERLSPAEADQVRARLCVLSTCPLKPQRKKPWAKKR